LCTFFYTTFFMPGPQNIEADRRFSKTHTRLDLHPTLIQRILAVALEHDNECMK
jgi:hypothetical protein